MPPHRAVHARAALTAGAAVLFAVSTFAADLGAQPLAPEGEALHLAPGTTVRVRGRDLPIGRRAATVIEQRQDTLVLRDAAGALVLVPLDRLTQLEVAGGMRPAGERARRGARVGVVVVGGATVLASAVAFVGDRGRAPRDCIILCFPGSLAILGTGSALTCVAALGGAAVGALVPAQRWTTARVPSKVRVSLAPVPGGGAALALGVNF